MAPTRFRYDMRLRTATTAGAKSVGLQRLLELSSPEADGLDEIILEIATQNVRGSQYTAFMLRYIESDETQIVVSFNIRRGRDVSIEAIKRDANRARRKIINLIKSSADLKSKIINGLKKNSKNISDVFGAGERGTKL